MRRLSILVAIFLMASAQAREWYAHPDGDAAAEGSKEEPGDIASLLDGSKKIAPGDTIWILEGIYKRRPKEQFDVRLQGTAENPIHVRAETGKRVTIDGGLAVQDPSAHVWIRDLEILVSEPHPDKPVSKGTNPPEFTRPWGGLHVFGGKNCKFINLNIHDCRQGVSWWRGSIDSELYGCVIYENGWPGVDRGHGHCIYTQNKDGTKRISNCILTAKLPGQQTLQAYGSKNAFVDNYVCEDNVAYDMGRFLIGGGKPSHNIRVYRNHLYKVDMQLGYDAPENEDCELKDNRIFRGSIVIQKYKTAKQENNWVWKKDAETPAVPETFLLPNKHDEKRAHLIVYNWAWGVGGASVKVPAANFLKAGENYALYDPKKLFGEPLATGTCNGAEITVPVQSEFAVFVLLKR